MNSSNSSKQPSKKPVSGDLSADDNPPAVPAEPQKELGGRGGLDPTRYGDWEKAGRCIDF